METVLLNRTYICKFKTSLLFLIGAKERVQLATCALQNKLTRWHYPLSIGINIRSAQLTTTPLVAMIHVRKTDYLLMYLVYVFGRHICKAKNCPQLLIVFWEEAYYVLIPKQVCSISFLKEIERWFNLIVFPLNVFFVVCTMYVGK